MSALYRNKQIFSLAVKFEFSARNRMRFYIKLGQLLQNGVQLESALKQLSSTSSKKSKGSVLPILYERWRKNVSNGMNFGHVLAPYIPSAEAILIETGANSGRLVDALFNAADTVGQQTKVKDAIIKNSAYPAILVCMLVAALVLSSNMVIPTFAEILPIEDWVGPAYYVAQISEMIRDYGIFIGIVLLMLIGVVAFSLPRWTGRERLHFEGVVPWSLYKMWQGSSFLLAVAAMMQAGVKLDEVSLARISKNADPYLKQRVNALRKYILSGQNLGEALHMAGYDFPEDELIADLRVYAKLRDFDKNLIRITRTWVSELVEKVEVTMRGLNLVVLILIAVVIGFLITSLYGVVQQMQAVN
jgi:type II secretory pathway component PulF